MPEKVDAFLLANGSEEQADSAPKSRNGPLGRLSQENLDFAEDLLNRVEVR